MIADTAHPGFDDKRITIRPAAIGNPDQFIDVLSPIREHEPYPRSGMSICATDFACQGRLRPPGSWRKCNKLPRRDMAHRSQNLSHWTTNRISLRAYPGEVESLRR